MPQNLKKLNTKGRKMFEIPLRGEEKPVEGYIKDENGINIQTKYKDGDIQPFNSGIIPEKANDFIHMMAKYADIDYVIERYNDYVFLERDRASYMLSKITSIEDMKFAMGCFSYPEDREFWSKTNPNWVRRWLEWQKEDLNDYINYELGIGASNY